MAAKLRKELARLAPLDPFEVLNVPLEATVDQIRASYLELTKAYHPNRFARESPATIDAANELFLVIRRAYSQIIDEGKRRIVKQRISGVVTPAAPPRGRAGLEAAPPPLAAPAPLTPPTVPPSAPAPMTVPQTQPPAGSARAPKTQPPRANVSFTKPAPRPKPPVVPHQGVPPVSPQTGRSESEVRALLESARTRSQRYDQACRMILKNRAREARPILTQLVAEDPQSRRFRVKLMHATAIELRDEGRLEEAVRELERAVALDPEAHEVEDALRKITALRKNGIFSKIFGK